VAASLALWRIAKATPHCTADDLSGGGAAEFGGRWNSKGKHVVYASSSIALATLETLAHLSDAIAVRNRFLVRIEVPREVWKKRIEVAIDELPPSWLAEPPARATMAYGDRWLASGASALLLVPSVIVHEESNVLINPAHRDAKRIRSSIARQFIYDPRLA